MDEGQPATIYYMTMMLKDLLCQKNTSPITNDVLNITTSIFKKLVCTNNVLVKQIVAESFVYVNGLNCSDLLIQVDEESQRFVLDYVDNSMPLSNSELCHNFIIEFIHKCYTFDYDKTECRPVKKFKADPHFSQISDEVKQLKEHTLNVVAYAKNNALSAEEMNVVHSAISDLESLKNNL